MLRELQELCYGRELRFIHTHLVALVSAEELHLLLGFLIFGTVKLPEKQIQSREDV